eukprot:756096-Hanusia_phi.AAC.1
MLDELLQFPCVGLLEEQQKQAMEENMQKKLKRKGIRKKEEPEKKKPDSKHDLKKSQEMAKEKRDMKDRKLQLDKELIESFLKSASELLEEDGGEIHVRIRNATMWAISLERPLCIALINKNSILRYSRGNPTVSIPRAAHFLVRYKPQQTHPNGKGLQPLTPATTLMYPPP